MKDFDIMDKTMNQTDETSSSTPQPAKQPYVKPVLSKLGSLREMTMTKSGSGKSDGSYKRFTGRGGHRVDDSGF